MTAILLPTSQVTGLLSDAHAMTGKVYGVGVDSGGDVIQVLVIAANGEALARAIKEVWAIEKLNPLKLSDVMVVAASALCEVETPTQPQLMAWLRTVADQHCRLCDGTGVFYGNVMICSCVNHKPVFTYDPEDDEL